MVENAGIYDLSGHLEKHENHQSKWAYENIYLLTLFYQNRNSKGQIHKKKLELCFFGS